MTEVCDSSADNNPDFGTKKNRLVLNAKSLSLELARQKHRLAAQLVSNIIFLVLPFFSCVFIRDPFNRLLNKEI